MPRRLLTLARWFLTATVLVPLVIDSSVFFPYAFPKLALFRTLVELALACVALSVAWTLVRGETNPEARPWNSLKVSPRLASGFIGLPSRAEAWKAIKSPLGISLILFLFSLVISMAFSLDPYRAFWGDIERGEGVIGIMHVITFGGLLLALFRPRDWSRYLKLTVLVGFVVFLYGLFQHFGITWVPFARHAQDRAESFIGNPAFLATYALFVMVFAWMSVWGKDKRKETEARSVPRRDLGIPLRSRLISPLPLFFLVRAWRWFAFATIGLGALTVFLTGTRGAMLGLAVGGVVALVLTLFQRGDRGDISVQRRRIRAGMLLAALFVFAGVFWTTRTAPLWQSIPGLNRLAVTAEESLSDASTETRLITWRVSWKAFLEKPVLGWGPEHYITAYERHYDPAFAYYGETWLDRAHSKVFDLLVTQGVVGTVAYVSLLVALGALIWRRNAGAVRAVLLGFLVSYVVQNLVLFDQVVSYLTFAVFVAWAARPTSPARLAEAPAKWAGGCEPASLSSVSAAPASPLRRYALFVVCCLLFVAAIGGIYFVNALPYAQARAYKESPGLGDIKKVTARLRDGMYPTTYAQKDIRGVGIDNIYQDQYFLYDPYRQNPKFKAVGDLLLAGAKEMIDREPVYDVRYYIRYATMLHAMARDDESYYAKAELYLRKALELSPTRQELFYLLAFNLAGQGRVDESITIARRGVALDTRVARAHFHLGLMLDAGGQKDEAKRELAEVERLNPRLNTLMNTDFRTLGMLYASLGENDQLILLIDRSMRGALPVALDQETYTLALKRYADQKDQEHFAALAKFMKGTFPSIADDMDVLIDLAEKGNWEIIRKL
ncbi:MAG: O-antigen ligase family protein [bacterium]|nr:O-antigen ligase family protein [bacterium]